MSLSFINVLFFSLKDTLRLLIFSVSVFFIPLKIEDFKEFILENSRKYKNTQVLGCLGGSVV